MLCCLMCQKSFLTNLHENVSSKSVSWSDEGGGVEDPLCNKIGYSEPREAESREGSSTQAESVWLFSALWYSILIGWRGFRVFRARFWLAADKNLVLG